VKTAQKLHHYRAGGMPKGRSREISAELAKL